MLIVKWLYGVSTYEEYTDQISFAEQWQTEMRAKLAQTLDFPQTVVRVGQNVSDLNRLALQQNSPDDSLASRRECNVSEVFVVFRRMAIARGRIETMRVLAGDQDLRFVRFAQPCRRFHNPKKQETYPGQPTAPGTQHDADFMVK